MLKMLKYYFLRINNAPIMDDFTTFSLKDTTHSSSSCELATDTVA